MVRAQAGAGNGSEAQGEAGSRVETSRSFHLNGPRLGVPGSRKPYLSSFFAITTR